MSSQRSKGPSFAFVMISWLVLATGLVLYGIGLYNSDMEMNEKGYYLIVLLYGLFAAVSVQKSVRDREEGIPVTNVYLGLSWASSAAAVVLLGIGLFNADGLELSEKGFFAIAFVMSLFAAIAVQKNIRDAEEASR